MSMDPGTTTGVLPVTDPTVVKPGLQTSEFWTSAATGVVTTVVAVLALFGKHIDGTTLQPLIGAAAILGPIVVTAAYALSRGRVKAAAHAAGGALAVASAPAPIASATVVNPVVEGVPMAEDDGTGH